jgi:Rhodopirellula transposase DDE domain
LQKLSSTIYVARVISKTERDLVRRKYKAMSLELDERGRRIWAATEASLLGFGGVAAVAQATGLAESTIRLGKHELSLPRRGRAVPVERRVRRPGGGRKPLTEKDPVLVASLDGLVDPGSRGDPMSPLRWTCKSTRRLAKELRRQGHRASHAKIGELLDALGYSLQGTRKTREGASHPDRNAQFEHINERVKAFQREGQPVVSVDTKKKELVGDFANKGREYRRKGRPEPVRTHDFEDKQLGKGIPYGVYDMTANEGWVSVGVDHDTAEFAVATLRQWWRRMGRRTYPQATRLLVTADGGGSNGSRNRLWKVALQGFADESGLVVNVCHFPPGTSKWNRIEHRMFAWITENWRGKPLTSHAVIVNLISNTTTEAGLRIKAAMDTGTYPVGIEVSDEQMAGLNIQPEDFHGKDWNYSISPRE